MPWLLAVLLFPAARVAAGWPLGVDRDENQDCWNGICLAATGCDQLGRRHPLVLLDYGDDKHALYAWLLAGVDRLGLRMRPERARVFSALLVTLGLALTGLAWAVDRRAPIEGAALVALLASVAWFHVGPTLAWECSTSLPAYGGAFLGLALAGAGRRLAGGLLFVGALAFGVYGYPAPKVLAPLLLPFGLLLGPWRPRLKLLLFGLGAGLCLPLLVEHLAHPETIDRARGISIFTLPPAEALATFAANYAGHFSPRFLLLAGDPIPRHHGGLLGVLPLAVAASLAGLFLRAPRRAGALDRFLLLCLILFPVPAALTVQQGDGHVLRSLLGGLAFGWFGFEGLVRLYRRRPAPAALLFAAVLAQGVASFVHLHQRWRQAPATAAAFHGTLYGDLRRVYVERRPKRILFSTEPAPGSAGLLYSAFPFIHFAWTACDQRPIPGRFQFGDLPGVPPQFATEGPCEVALQHPAGAGTPPPAGPDPTLLVTVGPTTPPGFSEILRSGPVRFLWRGSAK